MEPPEKPKRRRRFQAKDGRRVADVTPPAREVFRRLRVFLLATILAVLVATYLGHGIEALTYVLGLGIPAAILAVLFEFLSAGKRLAERGEGLDLLERVSGPFGNTYMLRGQLDGRAVRVFRDRLEIDVAPPRTSRLPRAVLERIAAGESEGPFSGSDKALEAAAALLEAGVTQVELEETKVIVWGDLKDSARVAAAAVEVALTPARIRWSTASNRNGQGCPYCHQALGRIVESPAVRCPACEAVHHTECWKDHGGCSIFRCRRAPPADRERDEEDDSALTVPSAPSGVPIEIRLRERA